MADHLRTPAVHRLVASPVGAVFDTRAFESFSLRQLQRGLGIERARAAADIALGSGPEAFLDAVGAPPAPELHSRIEETLARYARLRADYDDVTIRWNATFWGDTTTTPDQRVALERERRRIADRRTRPAHLFDFLADEHLLPPVDFDTPDPDRAFDHWAPFIADPQRLYAFPDELPHLQRSRSVRGPKTVEYCLRFESPSPFVADEVTARVYEPTDTEGTLPTLVFHGGWNSTNDQQRYWPEEEYVARTLAPRGYRVVLPEAPWHGRREVAGRYSGEPYLARAPVATFQLYAAAALETGVLVDWARRRGAPAVGVGGVSLGGTITLHVAGYCNEWPESVRPDLAFPAGMPGRVDETFARSRLTELLDVDVAFADAGWTRDRLAAFGPLLNPPLTPGLPPGRVFSFVGSKDTVAPSDTARTLLDAWSVPDRNRTTWRTGHVGVVSKLMRSKAFRKTIQRQLDAHADLARVPATESSV